MDLVLQLFATIGHHFNQPYIYAIIIGAGFLFFNEKVFGRTLFLLLFTMIYNVYLKSIWQMPLPPPLEGFAFPSGHMHSAFVFYGWLAFEAHKIWYYELTFFLLCLIGYGIVYYGYHYPMDILGAVGFGTLSMILYGLLQRVTIFKEKPYFLGFFMTLLAGIFIVLMPAMCRKLHVWLAFGALMGFSIGWFYAFNKIKFSFSGKQKLLLLLTALIGAMLIYLITNLLPISAKPLIFIRFLLMGMWLASCKVVVLKIFKKSTRSQTRDLL